jgi:hypothetical protein
MQCAYREFTAERESGMDPYDNVNTAAVNKIFYV